MTLAELVRLGRQENRIGRAAFDILERDLGIALDRVGEDVADTTGLKDRRAVCLILAVSDGFDCLHKR